MSKKELMSALTLIKFLAVIHVRVKRDIYYHF